MLNTNIAIIYHTDSNYTQQIALHITEGVQSADAKALLISARDAQAHLQALEKMDAMIFGSPTYFGAVSADFKAFMDSTSHLWSQQQWHNKIAAGFTCASNANGDQLGTLMQFALFAAQHGMIWVGCDLMPNRYQPIHQQGAYNKLGSWLGLTYKTLDEFDQHQSINPEDKLAFQYFGRRIAEVTKKFQSGEQV